MKTRHVSWFPLALAALMSAAPLVASAQQSLIDPASFRGPAADQRAYRVGDVLTIYVLETSRARSQAATDADRSTALRADFDSPSANYHAQLGLTGSSEGAAQTSRTGELRAQITARVTGVEANGLMRISGSQSLVINGEQQRITLTGLVRSEDISAQNTIWSNRIAEADVSFDGKGVVSQSQRRTWVSRVFTWLGLI